MSKKEIPALADVLKFCPEFEGVHPIAGLFPMKAEDEFWELVENVRMDGVLDPIAREEGTGLLIDGRNRLLACLLTGSLFRVRDVRTDAVEAFVIAKNYHAKKLTTDQRAMFGGRLKDYHAEQAKARQVALSGTRSNPGEVVEKIPQPAAPKARDAAGKAAGVNGKYVDMASQVISVDPALAEEVASGAVKLRDAHAKVKPIIAQQKAEAKANKPAERETEKAHIVTVDGKSYEIDKPKRPMFNETNDSVSWAAWTWNPVTGCNHGCSFCYAREIANNDRMAKVYPFKFEPAFHDYRLAAPANTKPKSSGDPRQGRVFVCSMADLFGKWVPVTWITQVFDACAKSPEWEYLFLTKWPKRYAMLTDLPKAWLGASVVKQADVKRIERDMTSFDAHPGIVRWISLEPMTGPIVFNDLSWCDLVVIGAQTSTNQPEGFVPAFKPKFEWVADVVAQCRQQGIPYYLKPNLEATPGMDMPRMDPRRK